MSEPNTRHEVANDPGYAAFVIVKQLNSGQWEASHGATRYQGGVATWPSAIADAFAYAGAWANADALAHPQVYDACTGRMTVVRLLGVGTIDASGEWLTLAFPCGFFPEWGW